MYIYNSYEEAVDSLPEGSKTENIFINKEGVLFPLSFSHKNNDKIVFFFPGAFNVESKKPKFQRSSYFSSLEYNGVSFFDPTLFLSPELPIGWFQGQTLNKSYLDLLGELVSEIVNFLNIKNENILFFGSSAGGIPAIKMAGNFPNSHVYICNIQTEIFKYYERVYSILIDTILRKPSSPSEYKKRYPSNYHVYDIDGFINLYYAQNKKDNFHYQNSYLPFVDHMKKNQQLHLENIAYFDEASGHNPISKEVELEAINSIFMGKGITSVFKDYL